MASLAESNSYLVRQTMVAKNTLDSSVFEGASPRSLAIRVYQLSDNLRSRASTKKINY